MAGLSRIRLELGRTAEFPQGSAQCGYEFIAPLTLNGHIDALEWRRTKEHCGVRRFWEKDRDQHGMLKHVSHGWRFDYGDNSESDEPFFKLDAHTLVPGNYVSLREHDGVTRPFRVVEVTPLSLAGVS